MSPLLFPTWEELKAAPQEEQDLFWSLLKETWKNNALDQLVLDIVSDRSEERAEWLDEHTVINGDAERIRHAGKMSAARISSDRRPSNPRYR